MVTRWAKTCGRSKARKALPRSSMYALPPHAFKKADLLERRDEAGYDESSDESPRTRCMASLVLSSLAWKALVPRLVRCESP